jgi:tetratricopeptide (TPR) repeat protein
MRRRRARAARRRGSGGKAEGSGATDDDKDARARALLAQANDAIAEGAFERALRAADASLAIKKATRAYLVRAKALQRLDRVDDALAALNAAEQRSPRDANVYELRGRILWAVRRKDEARRQFELFLEREPEGPRAAQIRKLLAEPR